MDKYEVLENFFEEHPGYERVIIQEITRRVTENLVQQQYEQNKFNEEIIKKLDDIYYLLHEIKEKEEQG